MNQNARALKLMDQVASATGLTDVAKTALIQLVNPFADFEMTKVGYYDTDESSSVVQCVKFSKVISAPASAAGGNWDCHVFTTPVANVTSAPLKLAHQSSGMLLHSVAGIAGTVGGVTVITGPAAAPLNILLSVAAAAGTQPITAVGLAPTYDQSGASSGFLDGQCRVIGSGFEVHNTTAAINLQGAVAVYRLPQNHYLDRITNNLLEQTAGTLTVPTAANLQGAATIQ